MLILILWLVVEILGGLTVIYFVSVLVNVHALGWALCFVGMTLWTGFVEWKKLHGQRQGKEHP